jgi:Protein of unknown function (DUF551)
MSQWNKISDVLPKNYQDCWVFTVSKDILDGHFDEHTPIFSTIDVKYMPGFTVYEETGCTLPLTEITHWMPYYTPEPPED